MKLTINLFDIPKLDKLMDENEFIRKLLTPLNGYWFVESNSNEKIREMKRLFAAKRIRYTIHL